MIDKQVIHLMSFMLLSFFRKKRLNSLPSSKYSSNLHSSIQFMAEAQWGERNYSRFADSGYIKNVIAFRSIHMIATAAASVPLVLNRITPDGLFPVNTHPLLKLLNSPNPMTTQSEFIEGIVSYKLISGNTYILISETRSNAKPQELYLLRPDRVTILPSKNNVPEAYRYNVNNHSYDFRVNKVTGQSVIMHLKNFHPLNDWYGLSPIEAAAYSIEQHNQAGSWNQAMLQNGARPSGALIVNSKNGSDASLSVEQYERLKDQIDDYYTGSRNAGRPILLEGGLEWKEMSLSPRDMDFIESKHSSARDIALAFGVPPQLLGIPGDNTYSNLLEARLSLWTQTILPHLDNIISHFNARLVPKFGADLVLSYDKDAIDVLVEKRQKLWQYVQNATFMTVNEKRAAFGLPPLPSGKNIEDLQ